MLERDLGGISITQIRSYAQLAFDDAEEAHRFAMQVYEQRLLASQGRD